METISTNGITVYFNAEEREAAELICEASGQSAQIMHTHWGLPTPADCRVYVMTSWLNFMFHSASWPWRLLYGATFPLWALRVRGLWKYAGGWAQSYPKRRAVGVKPPRLMQLSDRSIGQRVFIKEDRIEEKVRHVTCHELTHAFSAHLKSPVWLNEGLAMIAVDKLLGKDTVQQETLEALARSSGKTNTTSYRRLNMKDAEAVIYLYVRGYWITRYIDETRPTLLKRLLAQRQSHETLENRVAAAFEMDRDAFWQTIDEIVVAHFKQG